MAPTESTSQTQPSTFSRGLTAFLDVALCRLKTSDERIVQTRNAIGARAFQIVTILLGSAMVYRMFYLRQHPREYWELLVVLFVGMAYFNWANIAAGVRQDGTGSTLPHLRRRLIYLLPVVLIATYLTSERVLHRDLDFSHFSLGVLAAWAVVVPLIVLAVYFLDRRWRSRHTLDDSAE